MYLNSTYLNVRLSTSVLESIQRHVSSVENTVCTTGGEIPDIHWGGFYLLSHLKTEASLHLFYTLTTVLVWKSRSFILCYSLVIDATLNWRRVRVSTLKTHITREREGILFLRLEYILLNDIHNEFIICIWATSSLLWCLPNGPGVISKTCRHFPASLTPKCILNIIPGNAII